jgi:hypothetical protein
MSARYFSVEVLGGRESGEEDRSRESLRVVPSKEDEEKKRVRGMGGERNGKV